MGFLHEGHLALMREAQKYADAVVISIFVNPAQFGPSEDFVTYPRDFHRDVRLAKSVGVDVIFAPSDTAMYGPEHETFIDLDRLPKYLCGASRPGHFKGVATVVTKLFNIVTPQVAVFGKKDYQQWAIIRRLVQDLNYDIRIVGVPTVRESDGLAMSSRNANLTAKERISARCLYQGLQKAQSLVSEGNATSQALITHIRAFILAHPYTEIDYIAVCDPETLEPVDQVKDETLMALAVRVGSTRLIDNAILHPR
jgi:pantoate--beta-alanine ligase